MDVRALAGAQAAYYVVTGVWPLVHMRSFEAVTGKKREPWLVQTVGVLVTSIGASLGMAARRRHATAETRTLGATSAAALAGIGIWHRYRTGLRRIYLADAALELLIAAAWLWPSTWSPRSSALSPA